MGGHAGAPIPKHEGIPPIHFEVMSCTACHSGLFPAAENGLVRTARSHRSGLHGKHHQNLRLPHIMTPVFVRGESGKIEPHNLFWPTYWGVMVRDRVNAITPDSIKELASEPLGLESDDDTRVNEWKPLTMEQIKQVLTALEGEVAFFVDAPPSSEEPADADGTPAHDGDDESGEGAEHHAKLEQEDEHEHDGDADSEPEPVPVYVAGGKLHRLVNGEVVATEHASANSYSWPIAHDVRPASQSLGANGRCADCHNLEAPFLFGQVSVDSPIVSADGESLDVTREQISFGELDRKYNRAFSFSFVFRPWMKVVVIFSCIVLGLVLLTYAVRGIGALCAAAVDRQRGQSS